MTAEAISVCITHPGSPAAPLPSSGCSTHHTRERGHTNSERRPTTRARWALESHRGPGRQDMAVDVLPLVPFAACVAVVWVHDVDLVDRRRHLHDVGAEVGAQSRLELCGILVAGSAVGDLKEHADGRACGDGHLVGRDKLPHW